ncbi:MAG: 2-phospho-L-lactate transferase [Nitrososphaerales archaeon]
MRVVALAGGTGSAKLLRGLSALGVDLTVVANVGDNFWAHGLYVCPDVDIAMYTLAGAANAKLGWGIEGDTFRALKRLGQMGEPTWFALGDLDIATHIVRTRMLREGKSLTSVTEKLRKAYRVAQTILPLTDDAVETRILTSKGSLHLQEFWVRDRGRPSVRGVTYRGSSKARCSEEVERAIENADRIVICPANPVTSIGPMLAVPRFSKKLSRSNARVTALSPMVGRAPFSGPAAKLMRAVEVRPDSVGVARMYSGFLDALVVDRSDAAAADEIEGLGISCVASDTLMANRSDEVRLSRELVKV